VYRTPRGHYVVIVPTADLVIEARHHRYAISAAQANAIFDRCR
jgi:hypothetical protein